MLTNRLRSYRIFADDTPMGSVVERLQPVPVAVYGVTGAGKSYFMSAFCNEACRLNYRCKYVNY